MTTPQVNVTGTGVAVAVGLLVGGLLIWKASNAASKAAGAAWSGIKDGAATVGGWVNPTSDKNLAYQGVNAIGSAWTGQPDWNLGGAIYEATHPDPAASVGTENMYDEMGNVIGTARPLQSAGATGRW